MKDHVVNLVRHFLSFLLICLVVANDKNAQSSNDIAVAPPDCEQSRPEIPKIYVSVLDKKAYVKDLSYKNFSITEGKGVSEVKCFSRSDQPMTVGVLLDLSGSMQMPRSSKNSEIPLAVEGLGSFVSKSSPKNQYFIIGFASDTAILLDTTQDRKKIGAVLSEAAKLQPKGNTSLYDAVSVAFTKMSGIVEGKKMLLVVSDGVDNSSKEHGHNDVKRQARESGVLMYLINFVRDDENEYLFGMTGLRLPQDIESITKNTGGRVLYPKKREEVSSAFDLLAYELRSQYTIGFAPKQPEKKKWRKLKVAIDLQENLGKPLVFAPDGYFY